MLSFCYCLFFKQKTAYELRISDWSSDVCSSDLRIVVASRPGQIAEAAKIDAEGRTGWHYDARITPEYGLRPQMPANIPRQFATIDQLGRASGRERVCQDV